MITLVLGLGEIVLLFVLYLGCNKLVAMTAGGIDDTIQELSLYVKHGILRLQETWNEIGINEVEQAEKCESVVSSLRSVLDSLVIGERAYKEGLEEECYEMVDKCNESHRALGMALCHSDQINLPLLAKRDYLSNLNSELCRDIASKIKEIEGLEDRKTRCIQKLGLQPDHYPSIQSDNLDRIAVLLSSQIKEFENEMERRHNVLNLQLQELTKLMDSLELDRRELIVEGLISEEPDTLTLSDEAIERRADMIKNYKTLVQDNLTESRDLAHHVSRLHKLLYREEGLREEISCHFNSAKPSSLACLAQERDRLEGVKQGKLEEYVVGLKEEIRSYKRLCYQTRCEVSTSSSDSRSTLNRELEDPLQTSSTDTLDLPDIDLDLSRDKEVLSRDKDLDLSRDGDVIDTCRSTPERVLRLEDELETWESFYNSNSDIFDMVRKWNDLNDRFYQLEAPTPDKYNNRGGALLQSQKEASKIAKEIPKLEGRVLAEVDKMLGEEIRINGLPLEDYFLENRITAGLTRSASLRRSRTRKKPLRSPKSNTLLVPETPNSSYDRAKSKSVREKSNKSAKSGIPDFRRLVSGGTPTRSLTDRQDSSSDSRSTTSSAFRKAMSKRLSRECGLDKVGIK